MPGVSFSVPGIMAQVFGARLDPDFEFEEVSPEFGTPDRAELGSPFRAADAKGRTYYMPLKLDGVELPHCLVSIRGRKMIVETPMVERKGTVKEIINVDSYEIVIRGLLITRHAEEFPEADIQQLREIFEKKEALVLESALTDIFLVNAENQGNDKVVITDFDFPEVQDFKNVRAFNFRCLTDEPFSLEEL